MIIDKSSNRTKLCNSGELVFVANFLTSNSGERTQAY